MVYAAPLPRPFPAIGQPARTVDFIIPFSVNPSEPPRALGKPAHPSKEIFRTMLPHVR